MATRERRSQMALDDAYLYCSKLESGEEPPSLYKVCAAIRTLEAALESCAEPARHWAPVITLEAWAEVKDILYNCLVTSFPGYYLVYPEAAPAPLEPGSEWPGSGRLEFYPQRGRRREDSYVSRLDRLQESTLTSLRWCFAEGRKTVEPSDFSRQPPASVEEEEAIGLIQRLYDVCLDEATRGKKRAHQKWWQLYWEADSCRDKSQKHELRRQMSRLQTVWGRPS